MLEEDQLSTIYSSPIQLLKMSDSSVRIRFDYRKLNNFTEKAVTHVRYIIMTTCKWLHQPPQKLIHNFFHDLNRCHLPKNHSLLLNLCDQLQNFRDQMFI
ncbi:hypothetical protein BpHYR1_014776 [Brachionus plicatilis]|uniref:Uncharacterized protein n=1 Tax=Brachionus plicatilis TaxID=10195 RepID=A0A3M7RW14_BRAPC|nr:hypothetical protein BpHYR1_014776 [Brachionus plicatilis]